MYKQNCLSGDTFVGLDYATLQGYCYSSWQIQFFCGTKLIYKTAEIYWQQQGVSKNRLCSCSPEYVGLDFLKL